MNHVIFWKLSLFVSRYARDFTCVPVTKKYGGWLVSGLLKLRRLSLEKDRSRSSLCCNVSFRGWISLLRRIWGLKCANKCASLSWRQMYLEKHHLRFSGCYISKTTYVRHGETSYIDETYRPWYLVEYYRYLRFFPEGNFQVSYLVKAPSNSFPNLSLKKKVVEILNCILKLCRFQNTEGYPTF